MSKAELTEMMEMFFICTAQGDRHDHRCLLNTWNVTSVTEKLSFKFYLVLTNLNLVLN